MDYKLKESHTDQYGGKFYNIEFETGLSSKIASLDFEAGADAFLCTHRVYPYFMEAVCVNNVSEVPPETQWLAIKHDNDEYTVVFPLSNQKLRATVFGSDNGLMVNVISGAAIEETTENPVLYSISGKNFYELTENAVISICGYLGNGKRRVEKSVPPFADYFGWCTWDSFYEKVCGTDIEKGLESFKNGGFVPKFLLLDDGWQTVREDGTARGHHKLSSFKANEKFDNSLAKWVKLAKEQYGIKHFFVWHAIMGYWGGVDTESHEMAKYKPALDEASYPDDINAVNKEFVEFEKFQYGMAEPDLFYDFFNDYHKHLKSEGIDGVKVDVQYGTEAQTREKYNRVELITKHIGGLEKSVSNNFGGQLINCMSCSNDIIQHCKISNVMRSSADFYPDKDESHAKHIYTNAITSIWMGEFVLCDWDMFQTSHKMGRYHASARAISGSPVYVSDKVDEHDFELIKELTLSDGRLLCCTRNARPTEDSLFENHFKTGNLLKIFNYNIFNAVLGVFPVVFEGEKSIEVCPKDIYGYDNGDYALYSYNNAKVIKLKAEQRTEVTLNEEQTEILTVAPVLNGAAPLCLCGKLNGGAAFIEYASDKNNIVFLPADYGTYCLYCEKKVERVLMGEKELQFTHNGDELKITVPYMDTYEKVKIDF